MGIHTTKGIDEMLNSTNSQNINIANHTENFTGYLHLKVSLLQDSFVHEIWNRVGKQAYLETIHPLVLSNLYISPDKNSAASASVLLIGSSEEIGVPITINQTILPLVHCFGKGLCVDGIDVLVRIGGIFGESFIVKQMLPLLKNVVQSFIDVSFVNKPDPVQSWSSLALIDCMMTLDGLVAFLTEEVIVKELLEVAANTLFGICQRIGADLTALHILPKLKELFDELAFSQEIAKGSTAVGRNSKVTKLKIGGDFQIENRMDLVLLLYTLFASLLGIEKLRQCCATWLLLEQQLLRRHNWKENHQEIAQKVTLLEDLQLPRDSHLNTIQQSCCLMGLDGQFHNPREVEVPKI